MDWAVTILGSNAATPANQRFPSSQLLRAGGHHFLIDCGEGTQIQMSKFNVKRSKIRHIFISHLHADHYAGLIGLLGTYLLQNRTEPMNIYAPPGLEEIIRLQLHYAGSPEHFPLIFHHLKEPYHQILNLPDTDVFSFPLKHRIPTYGFLFKQKLTRRKIIKEKVIDSDIPEKAFPELVSGKDYRTDDGKVYRASEYTRSPDPPASYAYISDTIYDESLIPYIEGVSGLYHEATFMDNLREKAEKTMHTTTLQAAEIARKANAGKLIIGHFSTRYRDLEPLENESRKIFQNTFAAREGETIHL